jgi:CubicO group peptidase (beta-lactamase class C family)
MRQFHVAATIAACLACAPAPSLTPASVASPAHAIDSARVIARALRDGQQLPGLAITVSIGRSVIWREGVGFADLNEKVEATPETRFRIGSVSKLLTAVLLMRLAQDGLLQLDSRVGQYVTLPEPLASISFRHLAGHLGGVRHYRGNEFLTTTHFATLSDALAVFVDDSLIAAPGSRYAYSSYGYNLIGSALEAMTATPFPDLLRQHVLAPLGMGATVPDQPGAMIPDRARLYTVSPGGVTEAPSDDLSGRWPSGGFLSSTDDLARLGRSVLAPGFLSAQSLAVMLTPQRLTSGDVTRVGIGWRISTDSSGRRYLHHGGSSNGGAAFLLVYPEAQLVVAIASNAFAQWGERDALAIAAIFLDEVR